MKKKIGISQTTNEILRELINELAIPMEEEVELSFDAGNGDGISTLQGPECVFCIVMEHVKNTGYRLSELQLEKIDALPLIQCRLVLASIGNNHSSTSSIVSHFKYNFEFVKIDLNNQNNRINVKYFYLRRKKKTSIFILTF